VKVALVHCYSWPAVRRGAERYLSDLSWALAASGVDVEVITGTDGPSRTEEVDGVLTHHRHFLAAQLLARRGVTPLDAFGLSALPVLARHRYDVVHALVPSAALAARLTGQRTVYTVLGHPTAAQLAGGRPLNRPLLIAAARRATVTTALSVASATAVRTLLGADARVLPPGVRLDAFTPRLEARTGPVRILFSAAADEPRKGLEVALRALAEVRRVHPGARLGVSGGGSPTGALDRLGAAGVELAGAVDSLGTGTLEEVPGRYRDATVTVLPARDEAFGLALVESLACGTPVVCTDDGGMPEIVDSPAVGRVAPLDDPVALGRALLETIALAADPATPAHCATHARRWGWREVVGPAHVALYRELRR